MKRLLFIASTLLLQLLAFGQDGKWWFSTDIGNLALRQGNLRSYRQTGRWDFGFRMDYRPALGHGWLEPTAGSSYSTSNYKNWNYQAIGLGPIARLNFGNERRMFLEADAFYRLWWLNTKWITYDNAESYSFSGLRTERQHVAALRLLWGGRGRSMRVSRHSALAFEGFAGIGARWKQLNFTTHEGALLSYDPPRACAPCVEDRSSWTPTVNIGLRLALTRMVSTNSGGLAQP
jgi:hypothetical protein